MIYFICVKDGLLYNTVQLGQFCFYVDVQSEMIKSIVCQTKKVAAYMVCKYVYIGIVMGI